MDLDADLMSKLVEGLNYLEKNPDKFFELPRLDNREAKEIHLNRLTNYNSKINRHGFIFSKEYSLTVCKRRTG